MDKNNKDNNQVLKVDSKLTKTTVEQPNFVRVKKNNKLGTLLGVLIIIVAGIVSGYFLSRSSTGVSKSGMVESDKVVGSTDMKIFKDSAEGTLEKGGINGEGTHKLIRPGGDSQTVYLTSSVVDLNKFIGKKVKVWGETFSAQKAGWYMDVGRVEVTE